MQGDEVESVRTGPTARRRRASFERRASAAPLPGLPTPDAWSRRWLVFAAICVFVGVALPMPDDSAMRVTDRGIEGIGLLWPHELVAKGRLSWFDLLTPLAISALGLLVLPLRGAIRGMTAFLGTLGLEILGVFLATKGSGVSLFDGSQTGVRAGVAVALVAILGLLGVAVGNHVRKRAPASGVPSALSGVGGLLLLVLFVLPIQGSPVIRAFFEPGAWKVAWSLLVLLLLLLGFGVLGVRAFSGNGIPGRCFLTSLVARVLLFGYPIAMLAFVLGLDVGGRFQPPIWISIVTTLRVALLANGVLILLAAGLAAWFEGVLVRGMPAPLDAKQAGEVFG